MQKKHSLSHQLTAQLRIENSKNKKMVIKLLQQSTFRQYAAIVLSPFLFLLFSMRNCAVNWCDKLCFFAFIIINTDYAILVFQVLKSLVVRGIWAIIFHRWKRGQLEPGSTMYHCSGLRKCLFVVWSSTNGQNVDVPLWQNRLSRCWGALLAVVERLPWVRRCTGGVRE